MKYIQISKSVVTGEVGKIREMINCVQKLKMIEILTVYQDKQSKIFKSGKERLKYV